MVIESYPVQAAVRSAKLEGNRSFNPRILRLLGTKVLSLQRIAMVLTGAFIACIATAQPRRDPVITAVFSRSASSYERPLRADGTPAIQTYVLSKGGSEPGEEKDPSIDNVKFAGFVRVLGTYLAKQAYYPAKDGRKADLLLVVHWGKTLANPKTYRPFFDLALNASSAQKNESSGSEYLMSFATEMRYAADQHNADLLGYTAELNFRNNITLVAGAGTAYYDLINDIESERYYIIVTAYDFQDMLQHKQKKTLWRTVASIDARDNRFDEQLIGLIDSASHYFGKNSGRLIRQFEYKTRVNMGELKVLGAVDEERTPMK